MILTMTLLPIGDHTNKLNHHMLNKTIFKNQSVSHQQNTLLNQIHRIMIKFPIDRPEINSRVSKGKLSEAIIWYIKDRP